MFKKTMLIMLIGFLVFSFQNVYAQTASSGEENLTPLVQCGHDRPCTICDLLVGIKGVIDYLTYMMAIVGLFIITVAGVIYIVSSGDSGLVNKAKSAIKNTLVGIVIVLVAWLIVVTVLNLLSAKDIGGDGVSLTKTGTWTFECSTKSDLGGNGNTLESHCGKNEGECISGSKFDPNSFKTEEIPGGTRTTWECIIDSGVTDSCIIEFIEHKDKAECGLGVNSKRKPAKSELCKVGEPNNLRLVDNKWNWTCVYVGANDTKFVKNCSTGGSVGDDDGDDDETSKEDANRKIFSDAEIGINNDACPEGQTTGCTDVGGLRDETVNGILNFNSACGVDCNLVITAGSEGGHAGGIYSHGNGYKVDYRLNNNINNYITSNYKKLGERSGDGAVVYSDGNGNYYAREGDHWDVCYGCGAPRLK